MPFFNGWRSGGTGIPPPFRTRFFIFHKIQRAKALTIGHVGCVHCPALFEPDTMMKSSVSSNVPVAIPPLVVAYAIGRGQKRPQPYERSMPRKVPRMAKR